MNDMGCDPTIWLKQLDLHDNKSIIGIRDTPYNEKKKSDVKLLTNIFDK